MKGIKLNYDDVTIVPEILTDICSRSECNPYDADGYLPIFAAPMSSVVSIENAGYFNASKIKVVIPRSYSVDERIDFLFKNEGNFVAFSLSEANDIFATPGFLELMMKKKIRTHNTYRDWQKGERPLNICIDLANGHMKCLLNTVRRIKENYGQKVIIMTGNIANPNTYIEYEYAGVDYVRVSIGTGNVCSTSSNTAVHFPVFSLLDEIWHVKKDIGGKCKIIADGGIRGFRDIQKALIYADYVMIGSLFNRAIESAGKTTYGTFYWNVRGKKIARPIKTLMYFGKEVPKEDYKYVYSLVKNGKLTVWKENFGMSTKIAQGLINQANSIDVKKLKTSEGLLKYQKVEFDIAGWAENETDFLRSAMSYTNSPDLASYQNSEWARITNIRYNN